MSAREQAIGVDDLVDRATAELIASGAANRALEAGDEAPAFTLKNPDCELVSSADLLAKGLLVVSFYRGVWCPCCNMELRALHAALPDYLVELYKNLKNDLPALRRAAATPSSTAR